MGNVVEIKSAPRVQYGFLTLQTFIRGRFAALEDVCFHTKQECIDAAFAFWNGRGHDRVVNIFSIDTETGEMEVLYDYVDVDSLFRELQVR